MQIALCSWAEYKTEVHSGVGGVGGVGFGFGFGVGVGMGEA